jgi:hypothetical protein
MTGPQGPPGKEHRPGSPTEAMSKSTGADQKLDPILARPADEVPQYHPWARRRDAAEVEARYRRSVYYWRRRPACDRHSRRAEHDCTR